MQNRVIAMTIIAGAGLAFALSPAGSALASVHGNTTVPAGSNVAGTVAAPVDMSAPDGNHATDNTDWNAAPAGDEPLPEWFRAFAISGHGDCIAVGVEFHPHRRGIVCFAGGRGTAHRLPRDTRVGPRLSPAEMPHNFHWAGTDRDSIIVVWMGRGDTSMQLGTNPFVLETS